MSGFQIPGLTTLSQSHATPAPAVAESRQDEKADTKPTDSMAIDTEDVGQKSDTNTATISGSAENGESTQDMVVDRTETATSDINPGNTSNVQEEKGMGDIENVSMANQSHVTEQTEAGPSDAPPSPPSLISGLEALLGGLDPTPEQLADQTTQPATAEQEGDEDAPAAGNGEQAHPEWEEDSSPLESSSEDSSSSDSDDDSEDDKDYPMLGPEETARLLMEMEGGSDDDGEGRGKGGGTGGQARTKNELPEEVIPIPDVKIEADTEIIELGDVENIVETTMVIKANTTGEYRVLDSGSVICTGDRVVIAAIADLIGVVRQPRYTARFTSREQMADLGLELGTKIFYAPEHATYVFTQALQKEKGTDASNWHDEEAGDDEMEFSDDEKEAEHKRQLKAKRKGGRGGRERDGASAGGRGGGAGYGGPKQEAHNAHPAALKYDDDDDDDGPYKPLARPASFGQGPPASQSVETGYTNGYSANRGNNRGRGRGANRGRGNRGGPRGGGGGGGGNGYSLPPRPQQQQQQSAFSPSLPQQSAFTPALSPQQAQFNYAIPPPPPPNAQQQFPFPWPPNLNMMAAPPPPPLAPYNSQQLQQQAQQQAAAAAAAGMYFNPAFYNNNNNNAGGQWPGQQNRPE
ncbi:hypothetical protein SLS62_009916 [Diatrype stigma]|uniref:H/ACA ribonucleoprotein complex non-core subunit NAF1 n=1 Tax=Diatrype stigma TaxID=117547 RepID=A0AAN9UCA8_9PEZI